MLLSKKVTRKERVTNRINPVVLDLLEMSIDSFTKENLCMYIRR